MKRIDEVSSVKAIVLLDAGDCWSHTGLLISYETLGLTIALHKSFKDLAKSISVFLASYYYTKRNDFIVAVDSREDADRILAISWTDFLNEVISEIKAHYLSIQLKDFLHLRAYCDTDARHLSFRDWKRIKADLIVTSFQLIYHIWKCWCRLLKPKLEPFTFGKCDRT